VHLAGFAPAFTLSLCDSEYARKPPVPIASVVRANYYATKCKFNPSLDKTIIMKTNEILILILYFLVTSCQKEEEIIDITNSCIFYDNILSTCFYGSVSSKYNEYVFRNQSEFQVFGDSIRIHPANLDCDTAKLPDIDFNKYTVLINKTSGTGCSVVYNRTIIKDTQKKKIIYKISAEYSGNCKMLIGNRNWAFVPKIPDDYKVEFQ